MDEFAQSREDDDLFADEFEPVSEPTVAVEETAAIPQNNQPTEDSTPAVTAPSNARSQPVQPKENNARNGPRQSQERRQRGGRGGSTQNGLSQSRYASRDETTTAPPAQTQTAPTEPSQQTSTAEPSPVTSSDPPPTDPAPAQVPAPPNRPPAVRGDRSATGGPAHKKLTEEELNAKLAQMAILNAQKSANHRRQEADQAAFQHREKELAKERAEKVKEERKNERVMEMERARNRERKMKAQGGREWDSEKVEADIVDGRNKGRTSEYVRGGHGGVARGGLAGSRYSTADDEDLFPEGKSSSRGRGTFEIRGRGGRGRGGGRGGKGQAAPSVPSAEDFPSLPTPTLKPASEVYSAEKKVSEEKVKSPVGEKPAGDWAEEMATPIEEKNMEI
jgi:hypothetical protein